MGKYIIQKPREYDACSAKFRKQNTLNAVVGSMLAQPKYDGCALAVRTYIEGKDLQPAADVLTSTGEDVLSCDHIAKAVLRTFGPGWVVFGEAWSAMRPQAEISGGVRRHHADPGLIMLVYDIVTTAEFAMGQSDTPYSERLKVIEGALGQNFETALCPSYTYQLPAGADANEEAQRFVAQGGYDGLILRSPHRGWSPGYVDDGTFIKVKPTLSLDLRCIGVEEGKGKLAGHAGRLVFGLRGREVRAAGGTYPERKKWLETPPIGSIFEVEAMGYTEDGLLREPRIKSQRFDKVKADDE